MARRFTVEEEPEIRARICAEARSWIYTPFHYNAMLKKIGVDCGGLLIGVLAPLGLISKDEAQRALKAGKGWSHHAAAGNEWYLSIAMQQAVQVFEGTIGNASEEQRRCGNIILVRPKQSKVFCHSGIMTGPSSAVHAYKSGVTESSLRTHKYFAGREVAIFDPFVIPSVELESVVQ
jgi:cell wall-associated NlpC family hydrolase